MLTRVVFAALSFGAFLASPAFAQQAEYVGATQLASPKGNLGVLRYNELCDDEFSGSRMCTSAEVLASQPLGALDPKTLRQWVLPTIVAATSVAIDASGISGAPTALSCSGWSSTATTGLTFSNNGLFATVSCNSNFQIACCQVVP